MNWSDPFAHRRARGRADRDVQPLIPEEPAAAFVPLYQRQPRLLREGRERRAAGAGLR
jgi:hypothetical protein